MTKNTTLRALLAFLMIVLGNLQAWDSGVPEAGLLIVLLVSLGMALPPVALLAASSKPYLIGAFVVSLSLLIIARVVSPIPLPGLFLILAPAAMGLIFAGLIKEESWTCSRSSTQRAKKTAPQSSGCGAITYCTYCANTSSKSSSDVYPTHFCRTFPCASSR